MKFIKKPIEIEARQFTDADKNTVYRWASEIQQNVQISTDCDGNPTLLIPTLEGEMVCSLGDWIIVEPFPTDWRKLYPCKPDIFEKTYEKLTETQMRTLETEYEYTQALLKQNGHVRLYPADPNHVDHAFGYGDGLSISPACQAYIDQELEKWLSTDSMNCHIELTGGDPKRVVEIMFNKHVVNFCNVSNQVAQYAIARAVDSSYRKLHSRFLGTVEYLEVQENGVGYIHNYVTNMQFSSDIMERKHSSFLISTTDETGGLRHGHG